MILPGLPRIRGAFKDKNRRTRLLFFIDGMLINAAVVLTSGVFLSGYVIYLGGSDFLVGILNNSLTWASVVAVFSFMILERLERRKKLLLTLLSAARLFVCLTIFLPLVFGKTSTTLNVLSVMVILGNVIWGMYAVGMNVWLIGVFPKEERNEFIFRRLFFLRIAFTAFTVLMGFVLDWSGKSYAGFCIVFLTSLVLSLGDVVTLLKVPEPVTAVTRQSGIRAAEFLEPLRNRDFRGFMVFTFLYYFCTTIGSSFSPLYLIRYLKMDYSTISLINVMTYLFMITFTRPWSRLDQRVRLLVILRVSGFCIILELLIYAFLTSHTIFLLFLVPVFSGIGNSGFNAYTYLYRFDLMPEKNRTIYEGIYGAAIGLSMLLGPVVGGFIMNLIPSFENGWIQHSKFQLIYLLSFALAAASLFLALKNFRAKPAEAAQDVR